MLITLLYYSNCSIGQVIIVSLFINNIIKPSPNLSIGLEERISKLNFYDIKLSSSSYKDNRK